MIHRHTSNRPGVWRGFIYFGKELKWQAHLEISRRWRSGFVATFGYGGQEDFLEWTFAIPRLFFAHFAIDTPFKWHRLRPFDGKYGESEAEFGLRVSHGVAYLLVGHDPMGTYYSTHGRFGPIGRWLRDIKRNKQITLFRGDWILGKPVHSMAVLEEGIPVVVDVGQWDGDCYHGTAKHTRRTWKRRFSTMVRDAYEIDMQEGIPFPGKGENSWDCGDDAYFGFSGETIEKAVAHIVAETLKRRYDGWRPAERVRGEEKQG